MTFACPISKFTCRFSGKLGVDVRPLFERAKNGRSLVAFGARASFAGRRLYNDGPTPHPSGWGRFSFRSQRAAVREWERA